MSDQERTWNPGDSPILPDVSESSYPPDAVPLEPVHRDPTEELVDFATKAHLRHHPDCGSLSVPDTLYHCWCGEPMYWCGCNYRCPKGHL